MPDQNLPVDLVATYSGRDAGATDGGARRITQAAQGGLERGLSALTATTEATVDLIRSHAVEEARQVAEVAVAAAQEVQTAVEGGGAVITTRRAAVSEQITATARGEQAAVDQWHAGAVAEADSRLGAEAQRARGLGAEYGTQAQQAGQDAAKRMRGDTQAAADRSGAAGNGGGNEAVSNAKAEVRRNVGGSAANQLRAEGTQAAGAVSGEMTQAATAFEGRAQEAGGAIESLTEPVGSALTEAATGAVAALHSVSADSTAALRDGEHRARATLVQRGNDLRHKLVADADQKQAQIVQAAEQAVTAVRDQARQIAAAAADQVDQLTQALTDATPPEPEAEAAAAQVETQVAEALTGAAQELGAAGPQATQALGAAAARTRQAITNVPVAARADTERAAQDVGREMAAGGDTVQNAMGRVPEHARAAGGRVVEEATTRAAATADQTGAAFTSGLGEMQARVDTHANDVGRRGQDVAGQVAGNVAEGEQRVDARAATHSSWIGAVADWFARQWDDLVAMVSNWGFWVGLLITVVLGGLAVFFLGPWALLVLPFIGALAGAGAQFTNNVRRGEADPWKGVWDAAVEGFVVGAIFSAAIGIALWAGLGALGILVVVEIVTAVVTVVSNVIHGERPTKNLLANMLFAWLLDRIFRHVPSRGGGRGIGGRQPPRPPGSRQEPPRQEPPRQEPPRQEPPRQEPPRQEPPAQSTVRTRGVTEPVPGPKTLSAAELAELQAIADRYQTQIDVVGSRAQGRGRNIEHPELPHGKGEGTRSDIDVRVDGDADIRSRGGLSNDIANASNGAGKVISSGLPQIKSNPPVIEIHPRPGGQR